MFIAYPIFLIRLYLFLLRWKSRPSAKKSGIVTEKVRQQKSGKNPSDWRAGPPNPRKCSNFPLETVVVGSTPPTLYKTFALLRQSSRRPPSSQRLPQFQPYQHRALHSFHCHGWKTDAYKSLKDHWCTLHCSFIILCNGSSFGINAFNIWTFR